MSTRLSERPLEDFIVLFKRPSANHKNEPLALGKVLKISKHPGCMLTDLKVIDRVLKPRILPQLTTTNRTPLAQSVVTTNNPTQV